MNATAQPIRRAFVLGAGLGTRLRRLTHARPKPLVPLAGRPLIASALDHLAGVGVERVVINTHHCAEVYSQSFPERRYKDLTLFFRHEPVLLETGGGIKNVEDLLKGEPFIVYNGDVLCDLPLEPAIAWHQQAGNEVTLILRSHGGPPHIALKEEEPFGPYPTGQVVDIRQKLGRQAGTHLFTGIYLVEPSFFARLRLEISSVIPVFLAMIEASTTRLGAIVIDDGLWHDLGTREHYLEAHRLLLERNPDLRTLHPSARIGNNVSLNGATFIGPGAEVGEGASLHDCVLWNGAKVAAGSRLERCIITDHQHLDGIHTDVDA